MKSSHNAFVKLGSYFGLVVCPFLFFSSIIALAFSDLVDKAYEYIYKNVSSLTDGTSVDGTVQSANMSYEKFLQIWTGVFSTLVIIEGSAIIIILILLSFEKLPGFMTLIFGVVLIIPNVISGVFVTVGAVFGLSHKKTPVSNGKILLPKEENMNEK